MTKRKWIDFNDEINNDITNEINNNITNEINI